MYDVRSLSFGSPEPISSVVLPINFTSSHLESFLLLVMEEIRALELYSGIGGMHFALKQSCPTAKVIAAVDINTHANKVYAHNFPDVKVLNKGIEGFSIKTLNALDFNMVLMSPPCQPFTRIGLQRDVDDPRTKSFVHFLSLLPKLAKLPKYILLENVKGFEVSVVHEQLCKTLDECDYHQMEFLLSPRHLQIPNSRLRYFMLAKRGKFYPSISCPDGKIWRNLPLSSDMVEKAREGKCNVQDCKRNTESLQDQHEADELLDDSFGACLDIRHYLENGVSEDYKLPDDVKNRYIKVMDVVTPNSRNSTCFTKSYTQYAEATGSVLNLTSDDRDLKERELKDYDLRYFTPNEVAKLMCFPDLFSFPDDVTRKQRYQMLGNSLNVRVVSYLISLMMCEESVTRD